MIFRSTRGFIPETNLRRVALEGLAPDGGLYLPRDWPSFSDADREAMRRETYQEIAFRVLRPFLFEMMPDIALREIIQKSYAVFDDSDVTPLKKFGDDYILELFHGPTLAFKDVALQFLGNTFEFLLLGATVPKTVVGATSGDTGSAAIEALANRQNIDIFVLYPERGPSEIQRRQMTCVDAPNVHALAIDGSFDDCQAIVKAMFADPALRNAWNHTTVNSINLLRILAQIVYYFFAASRIEGTPTFIVPTGNFGDVFAGYAATKCGLPINKLVVASNSNNILTRFFETGSMTPEPVSRTLSPSMDIQISSNFERLLYDVCEGDTAQVRTMMKELREKGSFSVSADQLALARQHFEAGYASDDETLATMRAFYDNHQYILDPHTAVGVKVAQDLGARLSGPRVFLATAHPAKFPETVAKAIGSAPPPPPKIAALLEKSERTVHLPADIRAVAAYIQAQKDARA